MYKTRGKTRGLFALENEVKQIPLVKAILDNNLQAIRRLIDEGADVNMHVPGGGKTPLHIAIEQDREHIVFQLIEAKADVNAVTSRGFTPLHVAAQKGNGKLIEILIHAGANVNAYTDVGCTPLHEAATKGRKEAVLKLLDLNADPNIKDSRYNLTAANLANENQHTDIRDILIDAMTYQQKFIQNVNYILQNWKRRFPNFTSEFQFIDRLTNEIKTIEDADEVFRKVSAALKAPAYTSIKTTMAPVRSILIANMKKYNEDKLATRGRSTETEQPQSEVKRYHLH